MGTESGPCTPKAPENVITLAHTSWPIDSRRTNKFYAKKNNRFEPGHLPTIISILSFVLLLNLMPCLHYTFAAALIQRMCCKPTFWYRLRPCEYFVIKITCFHASSFNVHHVLTVWHFITLHDTLKNWNMFHHANGIPIMFFGYGPRKSNEATTTWT